MASLVIAAHAYADIEKIYVLNEIDDDHIIIVTEAGEKLLLEKWNLRFSPLSFEGKYFVAEIDSLWVTIYFDDRESIKWSVEKHLGSAAPDLSTRRGGLPNTPTSKSDRSQCFKSNIREPSSFLGNGGEIIILEDGSIWKEMSHQYLYLYEYFPSVIVCPNDGKMILGRHTFQIVPLR
nr:hypothetical protein [Nitrosomonas nitrosa]